MLTDLFLRAKQAVPDASVLIRLFGHRLWVGGKWQEMGRLQFEFMVEQGLRPHHFLLDIGCGALRGGQWFVPYLDEGHYVGADKQALLLERGKQELGSVILGSKRPRFIVTDRFDFSSLDQSPDYAIAVSLFTHLTPSMMALCLENLRKIAKPETTFFSSFNRSDETVENPDRSHSHKNFHYTTEELTGIAADLGWSASLIGDWGHARDQEMMCFVPVDGGASRVR